MGVLSDAAVSQGNLRREQDEIRSEVEAVRTAKKARNTSISADEFRIIHGGNMVVDGGDFRVVDTNGTTLVKMGELSGGSIGWTFNYDDGRSLFTRQGTPGQQFWGFWDQSNNIVVSNDAASGTGLARPFLPYPLVPTENAEAGPSYMWASTTASSPGTDLLGLVAPIQHPRIHVAATVVTDGGGTGHWRMRLRVNGVDTVLVEDETEYSEHTVAIPGWGTDFTFGREVGILLDGWVTGGGTRAYVQYDRCYGEAS